MSTSRRWLLASLLVILACSHAGNPGQVPAASAKAEVPGPIRELLVRLDAAPHEEASALVQTWLDAQLRIPIVDGNRALFLWRGNEEDVRLVGDMTSWDIASSPRLARIPREGAALQYLEQTYEPEARLDYKFVTGGRVWSLDPLNPRTMVGGLGPNSELAMPGYDTPVEALLSGAKAGGTLSRHVIESEALGRKRVIKVYVPPASAVQGPRPLVIFHDGEDYLELIDTLGLLDRLVESGALGPLVAVFADPKDRNAEYDRNEAYVRFLADEVVPFMRQNYQAGLSPETTGTIGPSMGGLAACYAAFVRPSVFGLAGCQSGAFTLHDDAFVEQVRAAPKTAGRFHLVVGTYELAVGGGAGAGNLLEGQRRLAAVLEEKGYAFVSEEHPQGHSWGLWRDRLPAALRYLYR